MGDSQYVIGQARSADVMVVDVGTPMAKWSTDTPAMGLS
jgi:hypothetical protein